MNRFFIMLLIPLMVSAQFSKSAKVNLNNSINLTSGSIVNYPLPSDRARILYPCSTKAGDFYINYFEVSLCVCACPSAAIQSPRPFHISKKPFREMNLRNKLNLTDTALYTKIDTIPKNDYNDSCALPFTIMTLNSGPGAFVTTTSNKQYALVCVDPIINEVTCSQWVIDTVYTWKSSRLQGYNVNWYVSNSGTPDFNWVDQTGSWKESASVRKYIYFAESVESERFTLLGKKVTGAAIRKNGACPPALYIVRTGRNVRAVLE